MNERDARKFLEDVREGRLSLDKAFEKLRQLPFEDLGFAKIDHHRSLRQGYSEVIYGRGKTPQQVAEIVRGMLRAKASHNILITRGSKATYAAVKRVARKAMFYPLSGVVAIERNRERTGKGLVLVVTAGTSDIPVAEEALISAQMMAGMEGALPSVLGGLVGVPVIAVPTSTGYGASFGGVAALLGMLNSCASNVSVVNIDNGFGAACVATVINRL